MTFFLFFFGFFGVLTLFCFKIFVGRICIDLVTIFVVFYVFINARLWIRFLTATRKSLRKVRMKALFILAFCVQWIECISLVCEDKLFFLLYLIGVMIANGSSDAHPVVFQVEDEVFLTHQGASNCKHRPVVNIDRDTITTLLFPVQVFTGVPIKRIAMLLRS